ncbi:sulfatase family protein [Persicirhabdus sediminis]|uniref:Sulfatase n=1 Tax=Persicirhabdus sediminis TaxID=454144 RepID=A0A8J7MDH9_9BACT|nr:sulfatase [Persicirhabdus sediminis]MBK1790513.1 sulfatase [Persicirhabdus sediminis]
MKRLSKWAVLGCLSITVIKGIAADLPNILWITAEDHGPHLGCYGDEYATTPELDALAARSLRYTQASSSAPVCAPARTTIISGMYPASFGAQNMRSKVIVPEWLECYPTLLRKAGYYTTNTTKQDYNFVYHDQPWHDSSAKAHWKNRADGQPFFAIFNTTVSHESKLRNKNPNAKHDPAGVNVPSYHPDTPEVRKNWAQYYDRLTEVDSYLKKHLDELDQAGLAEDTIVFFYADHGSGMPRHKRFPGWSGLHVPMIVHVPEKWQHLAPAGYTAGGSSDRLVSFIDLAPTVLSIAGVEIPQRYQGAAFMGKFSQPAPTYSFGFRGRMDERTDSCRSVTDGRFMYIRNYYPHIAHGQVLDYQMKTPATRVWYEMFQRGELNEVQAAYWKPHPAEELFDLENDPEETVNLANNPKYTADLQRFREVQNGQLLKIRDLALMPEAQMQSASETAGITPYQLAQDNELYPMERLLEIANAQVLPKAEMEKMMLAKLRAGVSGLEAYWVLVNLQQSAEALSEVDVEAVKVLTKSDVASTKIVAWRLLVNKYPDDKALQLAAATHMFELADNRTNQVFTSLAALSLIEELKLDLGKLKQLEEVQKAKPLEEIKHRSDFGKDYLARTRQRMGL